MQDTGANIRVIQGSHENAKENPVYKKKKHVLIIHLKQFEYIVCEPSLYHSGASNEDDVTNLRLHFYINLNEELRKKMMKKRIKMKTQIIK